MHFQEEEIHVLLIQGNPITHFRTAISMVLKGNQEMCHVKWIPLTEKRRNFLCLRMMGK